MNYKTFYEKFGGSARMKNVAPPLKPSKFPDPRPCTVPDQSGLPSEFIRLSPWEIEYLFTVARRARVGIVETGRHSGGSCFLMACAAPDVPIYSIDTAPRDDALLRQMFQKHGVGKNVRLIVGDSQKAAYPEIGKIDLLFVDGDHSREGCARDVVNWYDHVVTNGHLVFHDAYLGDYGVQDAIIDLLDSHPELQVMQSPFIGAQHWQYPAGALAHLVKRA